MPGTDTGSLTTLTYFEPELPGRHTSPRQRTTDRCVGNDGDRGIPGGSFLVDILGPSLLVAIGLGFSFVTSTIAAVSGVDGREQGVASGLINASQQIGGALGLAVLSTIATTKTHHVLASGGSNLPHALTAGFQHAFIGGTLSAAPSLPVRTCPVDIA